MLPEMKEFIDQILQRGEEISHFTLFLAMFAGSFFEYVFPPVPGDLWTAAGAILLARGQSFIAVFFGANLGSVAGFLVDYGFGVWLANPERRFRHWGPRWERMGRGIDRIAAGFERHTAFYLMVNRFLPGIRALFFVAAGFARVPVWKVVVFGLVSSAAWNILIIGAGYALGRSYERLLEWMGRYTWAAWGVLAAVVAVAAIRFYVKRRRDRRPEP